MQRMDLETELEEVERGFWLGDADYYRRNLTAGAVLVLPEPIGILDRQQVLTSIGGGPRWSHVEILEGRLIPLSFGAVAFVYRANGRREAEETVYRASCTSVYVRNEGVWKMATHQQTPLG